MQHSSLEHATNPPPPSDAQRGITLELFPGDSANTRASAAPAQMAPDEGALQRQMMVAWHPSMMASPSMPANLDEEQRRQLQTQMLIYNHVIMGAPVPRELVSVLMHLQRPPPGVPMYMPPQPPAPVLSHLPLPQSQAHEHMWAHRPIAMPPWGMAPIAAPVPRTGGIAPSLFGTMPGVPVRAAAVSSPMQPSSPAATPSIYARDGYMAGVQPSLQQPAPQQYQQQQQHQQQQPQPLQPQHQPSQQTPSQPPTPSPSPGSPAAGVNTTASGGSDRALASDVHTCRRTDGRKWRCSRLCLPGQKYCATHLHRGRYRVRKKKEAAAAAAALTAEAPESPVRVTANLLPRSRPNSPDSHDAPAGQQARANDAAHTLKHDSPGPELDLRPAGASQRPYSNGVPAFTAPGFPVASSAAGHQQYHAPTLAAGLS
eukprot:jgi/Chlat1/938/Chrsp108S01369